MTTQDDLHQAAADVEAAITSAINLLKNPIPPRVTTLHPDVEVTVTALSKALAALSAVIATGVQVPEAKKAVVHAETPTPNVGETSTRMASAQRYTRAGTSTIYTAEDDPLTKGFTVKPVGGGPSEVVSEAEFHSEFTAVR